jgi:hypothetical protein
MFMLTEIKTPILSTSSLLFSSIDCYKGRIFNSSSPHLNKVYLISLKVQARWKLGLIFCIQNSEGHIRGKILGNRDIESKHRAMKIFHLCSTLPWQVKLRQHQRLVILWILKKKVSFGLKLCGAFSFMNKLKSRPLGRQQSFSQIRWEVFIWRHVEDNITHSSVPVVPVKQVLFSLMLTHKDQLEVMQRSLFS